MVVSVYRGKVYCEECLSQRKKEDQERREEDERKRREFYEQQVNSRYVHLKMLREISIREFVPISHAVSKYRQQQKNIRNSDAWIQRDIISKKDLLGIKKERGRWKISQDRLEVVDFKLLSDTANLEYYMS